MLTKVLVVDASPVSEGRVQLWPVMEEVMDSRWAGLHWTMGNHTQQVLKIEFQINLNSTTAFIIFKKIQKLLLILSDTKIHIFSTTM